MSWKYLVVVMLIGMLLFGCTALNTKPAFIGCWTRSANLSGVGEITEKLWINENYTYNFTTQDTTFISSGTWMQHENQVWFVSNVSSAASLLAPITYDKNNDTIIMTSITLTGIKLHRCSS